MCAHIVRSGGKDLSGDKIIDMGISQSIPVLGIRFGRAKTKIERSQQNRGSV